MSPGRDDTKRSDPCNKSIIRSSQEKQLLENDLTDARQQVERFKTKLALIRQQNISLQTSVRSIVVAGSSRTSVRRPGRDRSDDIVGGNSPGTEVEAGSGSQQDVRMTESHPSSRGSAVERALTKVHTADEISSDVALELARSQVGLINASFTSLSQR